MSLNKLEALRAEMKKRGIDAYIVLSSDPHKSEYLPDRWKTREWISGFTGSAGTVVVTLNDAGLWTDSRYFIQAEIQLQNSGITLHKLTNQVASEHTRWIADLLPEHSVVGIDGAVCSLSEYRQMQKIFEPKSIDIRYDLDLVSLVWADRSDMPSAPVFEHDVKYTGKTAAQKISEVRAKMKEQEADYHFISTLDGIAWLYNLRGSDVECNPVFLSYALVGMEKAWLFVDPSKLDPVIDKNLKESGIEILPYTIIEEFLAELPSGKKLHIDTSSISITHYDVVKEKELIYGDSIPKWLKAIKNETEIGHIRNAMIQDGVALTKAFMEVEQKIKSGKITEYDVARILMKHRSERDHYYGESFDAIVGYKGNGAIVHYKPEKETSATIAPEGMLLIDSGGQYHYGTTDITRTITLSPATDEQKKCFTLVLKGHIALAKAIFPEGTPGSPLDLLARQYLWENELNFFHGTGHGVGFFLNVHEPPQGFAGGAGERAVTGHKAGMLSSNEPGFYKTGEFGIRIENLIIAVPHIKNEYGNFLKFETVTLFPIDTQLIDHSLMTGEEKDWLNGYHEEVYLRLSPLLNGEEKGWLKEKTASI